MPHVCYVVHDLPPSELTGTPLVALGYAQALSARGWDVTVVSGADPTQVRWAVPEARRLPGERFWRIQVPITPLHGVRWAVHAASVRGIETSAAAGFERILRLRRPDVVHVVDNVNLPLELPEVAKAVGIPVVRTVSCAEDLCGLIAPVSPCSGPAGACLPPLTPEHCADCVRAAHPELLTPDPRERVDPDGGSGEDAWWRADLRDALQRKRARAVHQYTDVFDRVVFSNPAWRRYFEATLPLDPTKARTIAMGIDPAPWAGARRAGSPGAADPVLLGVAGTLDAVKGADALIAAFSSPELRARNDYRLRCFGGGDPVIIAALTAANPHVEVHGHYRTEDLPGLLADLHVGVSPSYFETFHRVTREYFLAGLPVLASRTVGVLDVVRHGVNGLVFDHAEPGALVRAIVAVLDDRALLEHLRTGAAATEIRSVDDEADELVALYDEVIAPAVP